MNLAFSIDSILVAVAMSPKTWVVMTGGLLGIVALRLVVGQLITLVERYPALVDGAFVIIAWIGVKLCLDYLHAAGYVAFEIPQWLSLDADRRDLCDLASSTRGCRDQWQVGQPTAESLKEQAEELIAAEGHCSKRDGTKG